jgi:hypothetical protein
MMWVNGKIKLPRRCLCVLYARMEAMQQQLGFSSAESYTEKARNNEHTHPNVLKHANWAAS